MEHLFKKNISQPGAYDKKQGVVLLITMVVSSLILTIGAGILGIILKEITLSSLSQNSRVAFFAADSGAECAMYWDFIDSVAQKKGPPEDSWYGDSFFPYDSTTTDYLNGLNFATNASTSPSFCQRQTATAVFDTNFTNYPDVSWAQTSPVARSAWNDPVATTRFLLYINDTGDTTNTKKPCARVEVRKQIVGEGIITQIQSEGFSSCSGTNIQRSSRGVQIEYTR